MKPQNPKFSILIPTASRANLVRPALESTLGQTYRNFEVIIADSGIAEGVENLVKEIGANDVSVRYFRTPPGGPFIPWDFAVTQARGEYFVWLDDDNFLLPRALEQINQAAEKTNADIITGNHFYYYDENHPRHYLRNHLGILPWTNGENFFDPREALRSLYTFVPRGPGNSLPRLHPSETFIKTRVAKSARERLGFVVFHHMPSAHPHPVILAFAKSAYYLDRPVVIVGRLGESMSQTWSTESRKRFEKKPFAFKFSPFTGYTRLNARLENFLTVKHLLKDIMSDIEVNFQKFSGLYLHELQYLDGNPATLIKNWKNFFAVIKDFPPETKRELSRKAKKIMLAEPFLYLIRRLGLHYLNRVLQGLARKWRKNTRTPTERFKGTREFEISLTPYKEINSITSLAARLPEILEKEISAHL